jgi:hypothetical protein
MIDLSATEQQERWEWSNYSDHIQLVRNGVLVRTLDPDYLNALEDELKTLRGKAELADELLAGEGLIDGSGVETCPHCFIQQAGDYKWQRPFPHTVDCIKGRYDFLTQTAGEGQTNA